MKRSEINAIMRKALAFMETCAFRLPPFACWTAADWQGKGPEADEIRTRRLGWDITDFGSGDFAATGLFLFTLRNGLKGTSKNYAEKIMIVRENQVTPMHFHFEKTEDIINRGGGELVVQVYNSTKDDKLAKGVVTVSVDGRMVKVTAGGKVTLKPGESICLPSRLYHKFWGRKGKGPVLVGEVSKVNDDRGDNRFLESLPRFPAIEEDVKPLYLLFNEYPKA